MKKNLFIGALTVLMFSCASESEKSIEEARFMLDKGEFDAAIALMEPIVESEPNNNEAKFILGSALIGSFALEPKSGCQEGDTGYLGVLACLMDDREDNDDSGLKTFGRIAPEEVSANDNINRAVDVLVDIQDYSSRVPEKDVALQRLVARAFAISTTFKIIEANSSNEECNAGGPGVDEVPDDFDTGLLTAAQAQDFQDALIGIKADAITVGFNADFNLLTSVQNILEDVENAGGSILNAIRNIFEEAYNSPDQQVCS